LAVIGVLLGVAAFLLAASNAKPTVNVSKAGLALDGHDAVAYFSDGHPEIGLAQFEMRWNGARWRFTSAAHRDTFAGDPERYAPAFGGYCAFAVSQGYIANGDPRFWRVVDGRLYLNYDARAQRRWEEDIPVRIAQGRANWPQVLDK
jgi:hypothetical protein